MGLDSGKRQIDLICPSGKSGGAVYPVITGLDPVIHLLRKNPMKINGCPDQVRA
jgi:hypothetical protein